MPKKPLQQSPLGAPRTIRELRQRRQQNVRKPRECLLIVCEGSETEPNYFDSLRRDLKLSVVEVQIEGEGAAPITVVEKALSMVAQRNDEIRKANRKGESGPPAFDEAWCVFDTESPNERAALYRAVDRARGQNLMLAISNPSFEYWYLLHFRATDQPFTNATELIRTLKQHLPYYEKSRDVYILIAHQTDVAIERAIALRKNHADREEDFPNPCTFVYELVVKLKSMSNK